MKRILKKCLISIFIVLTLSNFIVCIPNMPGSSVYAVDWESVLSGLVGLLTWPHRAIAMGASMGVGGIVSALYKLGVVDATGDFFVTPYNVIFNEMEIVNVNFFKLDTEHTTALAFRTAVAEWYYSMRLIASMILLVILLYVGIRMSISTIAQEKAEYKKMLVDWVTSLAILFLLHYIMVFVFACNDALVEAMKVLAVATDMDDLTNNLISAAFGIDFLGGITAMGIYIILVFQTLTFIISYMKRMITVGFLIIIAPLITITYSIDKMGDRKTSSIKCMVKRIYI